MHMINLGAIFMLTLLSGFVSTSEVSNNERHEEVDAIIESLKEETWDTEEMTCFDTTLALLNGVKNYTLLATWVLDANQHPTGLLYGSSHQLGNFDQCLHPPWLATHPHLNTQYCTADVKLTSTEPQKITRNWDPYENTENYIKTKTKHGIQFTRIYSGVCVPASCRERSVGKLLRRIYSISLYNPLATAEPSVTVHYCQVAGAEYRYPTEFYLFLSLAAILFMITILSTWYQSRLNAKHSRSFGTILSRSFCLKINYQSLVSKPAGIQTLDGIRVFSTALTVVAHYVAFFMRMPIINLIDADKDYESGTARQLGHGDLVIDTFFAMSGLLHLYLLIGTDGSLKSILLVLLKRYLRLLGPLAVAIFYMTSVAEHIGSGPVWQKYCEDERSACSKHWIYTLLMLNSSIKTSCHTMTWYLSCDYQLAVLTAVIFYIYSKNKRMGTAAFAIAAALFALVPGFLTYWHQLEATPILELITLMDPRSRVGLEYNYSSYYVRGGPYLIGMAMGYILKKYNPENYRKTISKTYSILGAMSSITLMYNLVNINAYIRDRNYDAFEAAILVALNRSVWALAVCCIIIFSEYGTLPVVSDILTLPAYTPLSRLSYGIYLSHLLVIQRIIYVTRTPLLFDYFQLSVTGVGVLGLSCFISFVQWLLVEAPFNNLIKSFFDKFNAERRFNKDETRFSDVQNVKDHERNEEHSKKE